MKRILTFISVFVFVALQTIAQNSIHTYEPGPMYDSNAVCVGTNISIPVATSGSYFPGNYFIAELSDTSGTFYHPDTISILSSANNIVSMSGIIPNVMDGCNYYIRVGSTYPLSNLVAYGPFCIQHCDLKTNGGTNLQICLTPTYIGVDTSISVQIHTWNTNQVYNPGNIFKAQLLNYNNLSQVGALGALGQVAATHDTSLPLTIPALIPLQAMGIQPGNYYLRVVATNTAYSDSSLGSLIQLTIGAPRDSAFDINGMYEFGPNYIYDSIKGPICPQASSNDYVYIFLQPDYPYDFSSQYEWYGNFVGDSLSGTELFTYNLPANTYLITQLQEINYGCRGPLSPPDTVHVIDVPNVNISTPPFICLGDTTEATVPYVLTSSYTWTAPLGIITDSVGDSVNIKYNTLGAKTIHISASNICTVTGPVTGSATVNVITTPTCGIKVTLNNMTATFTDTINGLGDSYHWSFGDGDSSYAQNPTHTYSSIMNYTASLTVTNQCGSTTSNVLNITSLGITEISLQNDISIIPNPNNGTFILSYNFTNSQLSIVNCQLVIKDVLGREVYSYLFNGISGKETLNAPLNNGLYFWEIVTNEGIAANGKMVIIK
jgi:hypothetical protein